MNAPALIPTDRLPELLDRASRALAQARSSAEVLEARDMARVVYDATKSAGRMARAKAAHDEVLSAVYCAQADALLIEARAKVRLADEFDAAQDRGEVARPGQRSDLVSGRNEVKPTTADLGISRKEVHEARQLRDAEKASPGVIQRTLREMLEPGPERQGPKPKPVEPTRAELQRSVLAAVAEARKKPDRRNHDRVPNPFHDEVLTFIDHCEQLAETRSLEQIVAYDDVRFPTTISRLRRTAAAALVVLNRFKELADAQSRP